MTTPGQLFNNTASQAERERELRNDQRVRAGHTFQSRAIAEADEIQGRFAEINKSNVVGSQQAVHYPRLPSGPWADPVQVPPEEPLGFSVEAMEPVGTIQEIEASLDGTTNTVADVASPCGEMVVPSSTLGDETVVADGASPGPGQTAPSNVTDPSRGGAEAPSAGLASPTEVSPRPPQTNRRKPTR
jgi:hypothetical protein